MAKKCSIVALVFSLLFAIIITFCVTYLWMENARRQDRVQDASRYNELLKEKDEDYNDLEESYDSLYALYESLNVNEKSVALWQKLIYIDNLYREKYVGEIDEEKLEYYVVNGYLDGVGDKYASYYTADDFSTLLVEQDGNVVGIGVTACYNAERQAVEILNVFDDSPALTAGLAVGDLITKVGTETVEDLGYYTALSKIKGNEGTTVTITYERAGEETQVTLTRQKVTAQTVLYHQYKNDNSIGIVRITEFNDGVPAQFKTAVQTLLTGGCTSLVFDMRGNPGGTLASVVEVLDFLLPEGDIVYKTNSKGETVATYRSDANSIDVPMAVLVNGSTASAAELFTCALKDYEKAVVVGTKTYGKGTMQTVTMLYDGSGLSFSTNYYNPPKSANYEGVGITPNVLCEPSETVKNTNLYKLTDDNDNQLAEACAQLQK